mmetsp:Transcript_75957/g.150228  ORF Transcript_75957/g.150228 Transcript_75957/m.150228 type:complete len:725 (-) Transcript_75957:34-2208(-)
MAWRAENNFGVSLRSDLSPARSSLRADPSTSRSPWSGSRTVGTPAADRLGSESVLIEIPDASWIIPGLLAIGSAISAGCGISNAREADEVVSMLRKTGVTHLVNCAEHLDCPFPQEFQYLHLLAKDDGRGQNMIDYWPTSNAFIDEARSCRKVVLIYGCNGRSRAGSVAIAYVMQHFGTDFSDAIRKAKAHGSNVLPNIGFCEQLKEFARNHYQVPHNHNFGEPGNFRRVPDQDSGGSGRWTEREPEPSPSSMCGDRGHKGWSDNNWKESGPSNWKEGKGDGWSDRDDRGWNGNTGAGDWNESSGWNDQQNAKGGSSGAAHDAEEGGTDGAWFGSGRRNEQLLAQPPNEQSFVSGSRGNGRALSGDKRRRNEQQLNAQLADERRQSEAIRHELSNVRTEWEEDCNLREELRRLRADLDQTRAELSRARDERRQQGESGTLYAGNLGIKISLTTNDGSTKDGYSQGDPNAYSYNQNEEDTMTCQLPNGQPLRVKVKKLKVISEPNATAREETGIRSSGGDFFSSKFGRAEVDPRRVPPPCLRNPSPQPMQQHPSTVPDTWGPDGGKRRTDVSYSSGKEVSGNPYEPGGWRVNDWSSQQQTTYSSNATEDGRLAGSMEENWKSSGYTNNMQNRSTSRDNRSTSRGKNEYAQTTAGYNGQNGRRSNSRDDGRGSTRIKSEFGQSGFTRWDAGNPVSGGDSSLGTIDPFERLRSLQSQTRKGVLGSAY